MLYNKIDTTSETFKQIRETLSDIPDHMLSAVYLIDLASRNIIREESVPSIFFPMDVEELQHLLYAIADVVINNYDVSELLAASKRVSAAAKLYELEGE